MTAKNLVEVKQLRRYYAISARSMNLFKKAVVRAVDGVDLVIKEGNTLGLVGESGCGKTTLGRCILRLTEPQSGRIFFDSCDITQLDKKHMRRHRKDMQIVFQDPFSSLDPRMKVGAIIGQPFNVFGVPGGGNKKDRVSWLLESVGLEADSANRFPHEFSGGQRQRIAIARALSLNPQFIVADEPVSALDVSVRAQILNLMNELKSNFHLTYLYISHDLSTVKFISNSVAVMYLGKVVESGPVKRIFENPKHPYTQILIAAVPIPNPLLRANRKPVKGEPSSPISPPSGCRFHPRCPRKTEDCAELEPQTIEVEPGHQVSCHLFTK